MKTVNISGKEYVTVNERIKFFREKYPDYSLVTDLVDVNADHALIKASIVTPDGKIIAQGTAYETAGSSFINKTSHVENAETSAWGRALGNFGIGIDASVATADEVANAIKNQSRPAKPRKEVEPASTELMTEVQTLVSQLGGNMFDLYKTFKIVGHPSKEAGENMLAVLKDRKVKLAKELDSVSQI